jgi:hypothetical protein
VKPAITKPARIYSSNPGPCLPGSLSVHPAGEEVERPSRSPILSGAASGNIEDSSLREISKRFAYIRLKVYRFRYGKRGPQQAHTLLQGSDAVAMLPDEGCGRVKKVYLTAVRVAYQNFLSNHALREVPSARQKHFQTALFKRLGHLYYYFLQIILLSRFAEGDVIYQTFVLATV